jgi:hypothetical protein
MANKVTPFPEPPPSRAEEPIQLICMIGSQRVVLNWTPPDLDTEHRNLNHQTCQRAEVIPFRKNRQRKNISRPDRS